MTGFYEPEVWVELDGEIFEVEDHDYYENEMAFESSPMFYESVRVIIGDEAGIIPDSHISRVIEDARSQLSVAEFKWFKKIAKKVGTGIKKFGKKAINFGKKALPIVGKIAQIAAPIVGTVFGPAGTALGGLVSKGIGALTKGSKVLGAISKVGGKVADIGGKLEPIMGGIGQVAGKVGQIGGQVGNVANLLAKGQPGINQLFGLLNNPAFQQSLLGQTLGGKAGGTVNLTNPQTGTQQAIPFGGFMNLLGQLATKAAQEATGYIEDFPTYLQDAYGEFTIDNPASPEARAEALLTFLNESTTENYAFPVVETNSSKDYDDVTEWFLESGLVK